MDTGEASRDSLFGGAAARNKGKANKYADVSGGDKGAPAPAGVPAPAPTRGGKVMPGAEGDDSNRSALLAGGRKRVDPPPAPALADAGPLRLGGSALGLGESAMVETDLDFNFDDLNLTSHLQGPGGGGPGGVLEEDGGELDFAAIDTDMARFEKDEVIRDALNRGVDLRVYSKQVEGELHGLELRSIADYVGESDNIAALFEQICGCESVLTTMQGLLQGFQDNLGGISEEIRSLQEESLGLSVRMQNRKALNAKIKAFLARVAVSEALITRIIEGEVSEPWLRDLRALAEKVEFISGAYKLGSALATRAEGLPLPALPTDELGAGAYSDSLAELSVSPFETPAGRDAVPQVERLRLKAVGRVRDFLLRSIAEVVRPQLKVNMQKQQEYVLLKYAYAMAFLTAHGGEAAREVRATYQEGVSRVYGDVFRTYAAELGRLALPPANKNDVLGNFDPAAPGAASGAAAAAAASSGAARPADPFSCADRIPLLGEADSPPIPLHVAQAEKARLPFEAVFRSVQRHLADVAGAEATFCARFFGVRDSREVYGACMGKAIAAVVEMVESGVAASWDAPGLLLLLAITTAHKKSLLDRAGASPAGSRAAVARAAAAASGTAVSPPPPGPLDPYFDRLAMLVWPRFKIVFDANVVSIKGAGVKKARLAEAAKALPVGSFVLDEQLPSHILGITREVEALWARLAAEVGGGAAAGAGPGRGLPRSAFTLHQYAVTAATFTERGVDPAAPAAASILAGHAKATATFVDESVDSHFRVLTQFVKKVEAAAGAEAKARGLPAPIVGGPAGGTEASGVPSFLPEGVMPPAEPAETEAIVRDFALNWRSGLSGLNEDVTKYFGRDVRAAMGVLKAAFSRFVEVHGRLAAIVARAFPTNPAWARELVNLQTIYFEMRRYGREGG